MSWWVRVRVRVGVYMLVGLHEIASAEGLSPEMQVRVG